MKNTWRVVLGTAAFVALSAGNAAAQRFGVQGNFADDFDFGIGARVEMGAENLFTSQGALSQTFVIGSFDYFFPDCPEDLDCSYWEINANVAVPLVVSGFSPYVGTGLNIARVSIDAEEVDGFGGSETDIGLNLLAGLRIPVGGISGFGEVRYELAGGEQLVFTLGALLGGQR
jgi:opacity protein-like surface antigen